MSTVVVTENYLGIKPMIQKIVHQTPIIGLSPDEVFSEANLAFMNANETFDPKKGAFTTHVYHKVTNHLKELRRTTAKDHRRMQVTTIEYLNQYPSKERPEFNMVEFIGDLSEKAGVVVALTLLSPDSKGWKRKRRSNSSYSYKLELYRYLKSIGWTYAEIKDAFSEIRKELR
jgi:hypothetical protein